ncbi:MAG TPA: efflux RND transporter periplasmic adaptor subunit [Oculatellaceae cyanobacterium]|jgi:membrane fusion protein (multidrug efflux system)
MPKHPQPLSLKPHSSSTSMPESIFSRFVPQPLRTMARVSCASLAILLAGAMLSGCAGGGGWSSPPPFVVTKPAQTQDWVVTYTATGTLEANNKVDLTAEMPGIVSDIYLKEGAAVSRGQALLRLKADKQMAQLAQSQAGIAASVGNLEQQKADIQQAKARLESATVRKNFAESEFNRYQKLFNDQFISQLELDQKRNNYETALAAYQEAQEGLLSAEARLRQAVSSVNQARSTYNYNLALADESLVRAPFSGLVGQKYVDLGDYISPGQKLITVVDPSLFKIQFSVPERYLHQLVTGLPVEVSFEGLGGKSFKGSVNFIDPVVDPDSHAVRVKAVLPAAAGLRHGLFGTVTLALGKIADAVVIPEEAIVPQGEKTFVYVVRRERIPGKKDANGKQAEDRMGDVAHLQEVTVGYRAAGLAQIRSGLTAGERVITSGLQKVSDKLEVNLTPPSQAPQS